MFQSQGHICCKRNNVCNHHASLAHNGDRFLLNRGFATAEGVTHWNVTGIAGGGVLSWSQLRGLSK